MRRARTGALLAALILPGPLVAGCGGDTSPAAQVPALHQRLDAVDQAVAAHDSAATRRALTRLEQTVRDAQQSGDLDQQHADQILSAAGTLLKALPAAPPTATTSPSPSTTPSTTPAPPPPPPGHEKHDKPPKPEKPDKHDEHGPGHDPKH